MVNKIDMALALMNLKVVIVLRRSMIGISDPL